MKIVREHIYEAFKEKSDPISDMGIGMPAKFDSIKNTLETDPPETVFWEDIEYDRKNLTILCDAFEYLDLNSFDFTREFGGVWQEEGIQEGFQVYYYININLPENKMTRSISVKHEQISDFDFWETRVICDNVLETEDNLLMDMIDDDYTRKDLSYAFEEAFEIVSTENEKTQKRIR